MVDMIRGTRWIIIDSCAKIQDFYEMNRSNDNDSDNNIYMDKT